MASAGGGKMRPKRSRGPNKPYQRTRPKSFLDKVKDLITPSWLSNMWATTDDAALPSATSSSDNRQKYKTEQSNLHNDPRNSTLLHSRYFAAEEPTSDPMQEAGDIESGEMGNAPPRLALFRELTAPSRMPTGGVERDDVIDIDAVDEAGPSTQTDDVSEMFAPPSVVSSLYPNLDKLQHQQTLSDPSNQDVSSEIHPRGPARPASGSLWSHTPSSQSRTSHTLTSGSLPFGRPQPPAISTRRPSFNASYFGASRESLKTTGAIGSPFYPGKTTYGGASAQRSATKRGRTSPYEVHLPIKRSVRPRLARPADERDVGITSSTAKRILDTLEKMSTPLSDAKRIPISPPQPASLLAFSASRTAKLRPSSSPLRPKHVVGATRLHGPPVSSLNTPSTVSIAPNRHPPVTSAAPAPAPAPAPADKTRQEDAGEMRIHSGSRQTTSRFPSATNFVSSGPSRPPPVSRVDPEKSSPYQRTGSSSGGKMKTVKRTTMHYSANRDDDDDDVVEILDLPNVALPLDTTKSLPTFNFGKPSSRLPTAPTIPAPRAGLSQGFNFMTSTPAVCSLSPARDAEPEFTFASPVLKQTSSKITAPEMEVTEAFTFSLPKKADLIPSAAKTARPAETVTKSSSSNLPIFAASVTSSSATASGFKLPAVKTTPKEAESSKESESTDDDGGFGIKPAKTLKTGSCLEVFGLSSTTQSKTTTTTTNAPVVDLTALFKPPVDSWSCDTCLIQNKESDSVCVACQSAKPAALPTSDSRTTANTTATTTTTTTNSDLMSKFKSPVGSWECPSCMISNRAKESQCVACATFNPAGATSAQLPTPLNDTLSDRFKPTGKWECDTCLVQNDAARDSCEACSAANPTLMAKTPSLTNSTFGAPSVTENATSWSCDTCLLNNKATSVRCIACDAPKPGSQPLLKSPPASAFKFSSQAASSSTSAMTFGGDLSGSTTASTSSGGFKLPAGTLLFANKKTTMSESASQAVLGSTTPAGGLVFGSGFGTGVAKTTNSLTDDTVQLGSGAVPAVATVAVDGGFKLGGFQLGAPVATTAEAERPPTAAQSDTFRFGAATTATSIATSSSKSDSSPNEIDQLDTSLPSKRKQTPQSEVVVAEQQQTSAPTSAFKFVASADNDKLPSAAPPSNHPFQFGAPTSSEAPSLLAASQQSTFKFSTAPAPALSSSSSSSDNSKLTVGSNAGFSFGGTIGAEQSKAPPPPSYQNSVAATFQFGQQSGGAKDYAGTGLPPAAKRGMTFGAETQAKGDDIVGNSTLKFGAAASTQQVKTPGASPFVFGATSMENKDTQASRPNGGITFGSTPNTVPTQSIKPFTFGTTSNESKSSGGFKFGSPAPAQSTISQPSSGGFQFGGTTSAAAAAAAAATTSQQPSSPFVGFDSSSGMRTAPNAFGTMFGSNQQPTVNSTSNPFGGGQPSQAAAPAFGAASGAPAVFGSTGTPTFGAVASAGNSRSSTPTFSATVVPGFGNAAVASGPSFGAGTTNAGIGFAQQQQQQQQPEGFHFGGGGSGSSTPAVFAFGAAAPNSNQNAAPSAATPTVAPPAAGGFNFAQQQSATFGGMQGGAPNAVFAFGANSSPSQGTSFNVGSSGQRKIRKAVRRSRKT